MVLEALPVGEMPLGAEEAQPASLVRSDELLQEQPPEQAREHAHGQEEAGPA